MTSCAPAGRARLPALAAAAAVLAACAVGGGDEGPRPRAVSPDRGPLSVPVPIVIAGENFEAAVTADFSRPQDGGVDARFQVRLGDVSLEQVELRADGSIAAVVPAGLATGPYDLSVADPRGRVGTLPAAYRVLAAADAASLVASFRVDVAGAQEAFRPFAVTITALDAGGATVDTFRGSVRLSDATGTVVPAVAGLFVSGRWTGMVEVRAPAAAAVLTATDDQGTAGSSAPFGVAPAAAAHVSFATPPRAARAGECQGPVTLALLDAFGMPTQAAQATALSLAAAPAGGFELFEGHSCATPSPAPALAAGEGTVTLSYRATRAGILDLVASGPSLAASIQRHAVAPAAAAALAFLTTPQTVNAGACSPAAAVEVRDAYGNPSPPGAVAISLAAAPPGALAFFEDGACTIPVSAVALPAGATAAAFHFRGTVARTVTATASTAGLAPAAQDQLVAPEGTASNLVVLSPPRTTAAGECSDEVTLQAQDSFGNAVASAGAVQVTLSAPPGSGLSFFSDAACAAPIAALAIGAGQSTAGFHTRGTRAGAVEVTASSTTLTDAVQAQQVVAGAPAALAFGTAPQTVAAGSCSGEVTLVLQDPWGNLSAAGAPVPASVAASEPTSFAFYSDPLCASPAGGATIAAGASSARVFFRGTAAGTVAVSATASGLAGASQDAVVRPAAADRVAFASAPQAIAAGTCSGAAALDLVDAHGNPSPIAAGAAVALSASPVGGLAFFADAACATPIAQASVPPGAARVTFFFTGTTPGTVTVTAAAPGLQQASQAETVDPGAPVQLAFATPELTIDAGACSAAVTVEVRDAHGNATAAPAAVAVELSAPLAAGVTFHEGAGCAGPAVVAAAVPAGAGAATISFRATAAGVFTVTASSPPLAPATQAETIRPAAPDRLAFASAPQTRQAGACSAAVAVEARDPFGNLSPVAAATAVTLGAAPAGDFGFYADASCTLPLLGGATIAADAGAATFHFMGTAPGDVTVTASAAGLADALPQVERITAGAPDRLAIVGGAQTLDAGECSGAMRLESEDAWGNAVPVAATTTVGLVAVPDAGFTFHAGAGCGGGAVGSIDIAAGETSAIFSFRGTAPGSVTVVASAAGRSPASEDATIAAGPPHHLAFVTGPQTRSAGSCSAPVTLELRDAYENPTGAAADGWIALEASPGAGFALHAGAGCGGGAVGSIPLAAGASTATFSFLGTAARAVTVTASAPGTAPDPAQVETIAAGPPHHLVLEGGPQSVAAGACSAPVTVRALDAFGNPSTLATPATVALDATPGLGFRFHAGAGCAAAPTGTVAIAAGASAATFSFVGTAAGDVSVTAAAAGMAPDPAEAHAVVPAPPDRLAFLTPPRTTVAGACSAVARVESRDPYGNPSAVAASTDAVLDAAPAAGFSFHSDPGCATPIAAATLAAGTSTADLYWRGTAAGDALVSASVAQPGWTLGASQAATVAAGAADRLAWDAIPSPQAQGVPFAVTLRALDAWGNPATSFTGTADLAASAGTVSCASSCSGADATGGFTAGVWTGSLALEPWGAGLSITAASGAVSGTSNAFDVSGAASRSPPTARFTVSPAVIVAGQTVAFDASASSDHQTPSAQLEVSWDFQAGAASFTSASSPRTTPPTAPWTAWTATTTASHAYGAAGTYFPRLAVRDTEAGSGGPDVGYAAATVVVLPSAASLCTVDTAADVDDGATSCSNPALRGSDGRLSLREALRLVNAWGASTPTVTFSGPMTISGAGTLTIGHRVNLVAPAGVILDTLPLSIASTGVLVSGLELARQAAAVTVQAGADASFRDVYLHDGAGLLVAGSAHLLRVRMSGCAGTCVRVDGSGARLAVWYSELRGSGGDEGIRLEVCGAPAGSGVYQFSPWLGASVLSGFDTAVRSSCAGAAVYSNTFVGNGTGVYGTGQFLLSNVFSGQTVAAFASAACASAFDGYSPRQQLVWQNASDGCLAGEIASPPTSTTDTFSADPLFVFPAARDYRIQHGSPARDSGFDYVSVGYPQDLNDAGPGYYFGAADRGGRETY